MQLSHRRKQWLFGLVLVLAAAVAIGAGARAYRAFQLLQSAVAAGASETGSVRAWMTLKFVAESYSVSESELRRGLGVSDALSPTTTLRDIAVDQGIDPFQYLTRVQQVLARAEKAPPPPSEPEGWFSVMQSSFMEAVLLYGYPALALVLLLGAFGLPVPTGLSATVAGALAARGEFDLAALALIAVTSSVIGDLAAYSVGRRIGAPTVARYGPWVGYTPHNQVRIERLFARWGPATVLMTRTFASHLSSVASLLAGFHRYAILAFTLYSLAGRVLWSGAYIGIGYLLGGQLESASRLLGSLSVTLVSAAVAVIAGLQLWRQSRQRA